MKLLEMAYYAGTEPLFPGSQDLIASWAIRLEDALVFRTLTALEQGVEAREWVPMRAAGGWIAVRFEVVDV